ncbi:hypothetical protein Nepgr_019562 [Nepenthes gracilis]|uniref:Uncharacterized protein n=1 Tax=Nepenthes gracilis TaxID=150966 RepID=A0AAD3SXB4_NEPGR|nr:hypothetical protein Nepgr_019562 [Nepenthes gracilis]
MSIICSEIILRVDDPLCPKGVERAMSVITVLFLVFQNQVMGDFSDPQVIERLSCILLMHRWLLSAEDKVGRKICYDSFTASLFNVQLNVAEKGVAMEANWCSLSKQQFEFVLHVVLFCQASMNSDAPFCFLGQ